MLITLKYSVIPYMAKPLRDGDSKGIICLEWKTNM